MNLSEISYPVYLLKNSPPNDIDNCQFYSAERYTEDETGEIITDTKLRMVDDKSLPGASLATRRLQLKAMGVPLHPLRKALFFLGDLIKAATPSTYFIDAKGKIFKYQKEKRARLVCKKITNSFRIDTGGAIIEVEGIHRFKALHTPDPKLQWAGVLMHGMALILYGLYEEPFDETWRLI